MLKNIIDLLQCSDWYGAGECVEIAKGKNEMPKSLKDAKIKFKRQWLSRK